MKVIKITECKRTADGARAVLRDPVTGGIIAARTYKNLQAAEAAATRYRRKIDMLYNLCFSFCMDGGTEAEPISLQDAAETLQAWRVEDPEILAGAGPVPAELFQSIWNDTVNQLTGGANND